MPINAKFTKCAGIYRRIKVWSCGELWSAGRHRTGRRVAAVRAGGGSAGKGGE